MQGRAISQISLLSVKEEYTATTEDDIGSDQRKKHSKNKNSVSQQPRGANSLEARSPRFIIVQEPNIRLPVLSPQNVKPLQLPYQERSDKHGKYDNDGA